MSCSLVSASGRALSPVPELPEGGLEGLEAWELPPESVTLCSLLGSGASAEVFLGTLLGYGQVAVKRFAGGTKRMSCRAREALARELDILSRVRHENICQMLGVVACRSVEIVMELCHCSCFDLLHEATNVALSWDQKLCLLEGTADAMIYLHNLDPPIIHRDLKSLNVLLADPILSWESVPKVKLTDFGLSRVKGLAGKFMTNQVGTSRWMAPELLRATGTYDEKVDVYSFGMFVYEVVCRRVPFESCDDMVELSSAIQAGTRPDLGCLPKDSPVTVRSLLQFCWHHDPSVRPTFSKTRAYLGVIAEDLYPQDVLVVSISET